MAEKPVGLGRPGRTVERGLAPPEVRVSEVAREALQADERRRRGWRRDAPLDPKLELVRAIVEMLTGRSIRVLSSEDIQADAAAEAPAGAGAAAGPISASNIPAVKPSSATRRPASRPLVRFAPPTGVTFPSA